MRYTVCLLADNAGRFYVGIAEVIGVGTNELTLFGYCDYKNAKYVCVCLWCHLHTAAICSWAPASHGDSCIY